MSSHSSDIIKFLGASIEKAQVIQEPFPVIHLRNCFPPSLYHEMISNFPDPKRYSEVKHAHMIRPNGTSRRSSFELTPENLATLPVAQKNIWSSIYQVFYSGTFKDVLFRKLSPELARRFSCDPQNVGAIYSSPRLMLNRDEKGFKIGPHPDAPAKIVTVMFYLAKDSSQKNFGTSFYELGEKQEILSHRRFDFLPNSGYAFVVTDQSWHGREPLPVRSLIRHTLALNYYATEEAARGLDEATKEKVSRAQAVKMAFREIEEELKR